MQELLTVGGGWDGRARGEVLLDINFSRQMAGDTVVIDQSGKNTFTKTGPGVAVVESNPLGNCINFSSGASFFSTGKTVDVASEAVEIRILLESALNVGSSNKMAWCTGDYPGAIFTPGIAHYSLLGSGSPQLFCVDSDATYKRISTFEQVGAINDFIFTTDPSARTITVEELTRGEKRVNLINSWFGPGMDFSFGGSYYGGVSYAPFTGKIWRLKIQKMI
ncbi:hypothetical protein P7_038 [Pectobacterium phage vB_PcaM_P7_Pc]|nr:hypothetical protein P7_038 [Pectobacterium phage vB_PcaM_P7_Pc]